MFTVFLATYLKGAPLSKIEDEPDERLHVANHGYGSLGQLVVLEQDWKDGDTDIECNEGGVRLTDTEENGKR